MSIEKLRQLAGLDIPFNANDDDEIDELRVLMAAGLIAGLTLRVPAGVDGGPDRAARVIRVLAITPEGRRLLQRSGAAPGVPSTH